MNRRLGRRLVLNVRPGSGATPAVGMRWGAAALAVAFGTVFGLYLTWRCVNWMLNRFLYENPAFAIQRIDVQTDGLVAADQIRRWSGVRLGQNLLALDLAGVKRNLELVPIIKMATVERVLPRSLRIRVVEREPLAQVFVPQPRAGGGYEMLQYYLDEEGYVIPPLNVHRGEAQLTQPLPQYPVIGGINFAGLYPGRRIESPPVQAALKLIVAFERSPMVGLDELRRIDVSSSDVLEVTTGQGSQVIFGLSDPDRQLRRWREIYELGQKKQMTIAWLDLAVSNNIPVRWAQAGSSQPAAPKTLKPLHQKKKNV